MGLGCSGFLLFSAFFFLRHLAGLFCVDHLIGVDNMRDFFCGTFGSFKKRLNPPLHMPCNCPNIGRTFLESNWIFEQEHNLVARRLYTPNRFRWSSRTSICVQMGATENSELQTRRHKTGTYFIAKSQPKYHIIIGRENNYFLVTCGPCPKLGFDQTRFEEGSNGDQGSTSLGIDQDK